MTRQLLSCVVTVLVGTGVLTSAQGSPASDSADRGLEALRSGDFSQAIEDFERAVADSPEDLQARLLLARAYAGLADTMPATTQEEWDAIDALLGKAEDSLREALRLDREHGEAWAMLGHNLLMRGAANEAVGTLYHARKFRPTDLGVLRDLAESLLLARTYALEVGDLSDANAKLEEAQGVLKDGLELATAHADLLRSMAEVHALQGDSEAALQAYRKAITLRPSEVALHDSMKAVTLEEKSFEDSLRFYEGLVDAPALADWYSAQTHLLQGHVHFNADKDFESAATEYQAAETELRRSAREEPEYRAAAMELIPWIRSYRGYALLECGDLAGAEAAFLSALDRARGHANALAGLQALMDAHWNQMGGEGAPAEEFDGLRAFAARCCVAVPDNADFWNNYGFFAREAQKYEESFQAYRRAVDLEPDNARFVNDAALILVYHLARDLDWAEDMLFEARDLALVEIDEAKSNAEKAVATETYGDSLVNLVTLYDGLGRKDDAREVLARIREELPDRREIGFWRKRLHPEEVAAEEEAARAAKEAAEEQGDSGDAATRADEGDTSSESSQDAAGDSTAGADAGNG